MEFIADQFRTHNPNGEGLGVFHVLKAKDRWASLRSNGDTYALTIQRYGVDPQRLYMSEKMFVMVRELFQNYDPAKDQEWSASTLVEELFDGDFAKPGGVWKR